MANILNPAQLERQIGTAIEATVAECIDAMIDEEVEKVRPKIERRAREILAGAAMEVAQGVDLVHDSRLIQIQLRGPVAPQGGKA